MTQLEMLWEYQKADVEAERLENAMKRSPARQRLLKYQEFIRVRGVFQARVRILTLTLSEIGNLKGFGQN